MAGVSCPYKPVGIFWDIENCAVPKQKSAAAIIAHIRSHFVSNRLNHREFEFLIACDITRLRKDVPEDVNRAGGVILAHVNGLSKNAADEKIRESMKKFVDTHITIVAPILILISGDIDFINDLRGYQMRLGCQIILIHAPKCSAEFKIGWNELYAFEQFCAAVPSKVAVPGGAAPSPKPNNPQQQQAVGIKAGANANSKAGQGTATKQKEAQFAQANQQQQQKKNKGPAPVTVAKPQQPGNFAQVETATGSLLKLNTPAPKKQQQNMLNSTAGKPAPLLVQIAHPGVITTGSKERKDSEGSSHSGIGSVRSGVNEVGDVGDGKKKKKKKKKNAQQEEQASNAAATILTAPNANANAKNATVSSQDRCNLTAGVGQLNIKSESSLGDFAAAKAALPPPAPVAAAPGKPKLPNFILVVMGLPGKMDHAVLRPALQEYATQVGGKVRFVKNGQGYIGFNTKENADRALKLFDGVEVYGKKLNVSYATRIPFDMKGFPTPSPDHAPGKEQEASAPPPNPHEDFVMVETADLPPAAPAGTGTGAAVRQPQSQPPKPVSGAVGAGADAGRLKEAENASGSRPCDEPESQSRGLTLADATVVGTIAGAMIREITARRTGSSGGHGGAPAVKGQETCPIQ